MVVGKLRKTITLVIMMLLLISSCQKQEIRNDEQKNKSKRDSKSCY